MSNEFDDIFQRSSAWTQRVNDVRPNAPDGEQIVGSGPYKPYGYTPADDLDTCDITWWLVGDVPQGQQIAYRFLIRASYIGDDQLHLILSDCILAIEGKHLHDLRKRVMRGRVTFIQAFNPRVWPKPPDGEPIVTKIRLLYPGETPDSGRQ
ncbi:MAG TPA: hypothetical protein VII56_12785 [Rhizomicrobium sp.]